VKGPDKEKEPGAGAGARLREIQERAINQIHCQNTLIKKRNGIDGRKEKKKGNWWDGGLQEDDQWGTKPTLDKKRRIKRGQEAETKRSWSIRESGERNGQREKRRGGRSRKAFEYD